MRVFRQPVFVAWGTAGKIDVVALHYASCKCTRGRKNTGPVVGEGGAVNVETSQDLGDALVETEDNLDVAVRVLRDDGDCVAGSDRATLGLAQSERWDGGNGRSLPKKVVPDGGLDCFDLGNGFFLVRDAVEEEIDVRGGGQDFVVPIAESTFAFGVLIRNSEKRSQDRRTRDCISISFVMT
jgi:hypothetical protein